MATMTRAEPQKVWPADSIGRLLTRATASHAAAVSVLMLVSLLAFLPGFFQIPPVDRDEAYFAQATKQMIETGDYSIFVIRTMCATANPRCLEQ